MNGSVNWFGNKIPVFKKQNIQRKGIFGLKSIQFKVQFEPEFQIRVTDGEQLVFGGYSFCRFSKAILLFLNSDHADF